jgi:iron complex outermembrane recepter protein
MGSQQLFGGTVLAFLGLAQPAMADSAPPQPTEIIVTAQRRAEKSRDVPITITSINTDQLATANVTSLSGIAQLTPGLRFDAAGPAIQPTIRGVGTAISTSGGGPDVGIYVDGFFQPNTYTTDFDLTKVKDIEVLKGPQGTLFGRNTPGGAIVVNTPDPSTTPGGEVKVSYARFNALTMQAYLTMGLTKDIAWDIEGNFRRGDGYYTNIVNGDHDVGKYRNWSVRSALKAQISPDVSVMLRYIHAEKNDPTSMDVNAYVDPGSAGFFNQVSAAGKAYYGLQGSTGLPLIQLGGSQGAYGPIAGSYATTPGQVALAAPVSFRARSDAGQLTVKANLGFANLTSYTEYRFDKTPYFGDLDDTTLNIYHINVNVYDATFSQEFLLNSKPNTRLQWTAGASFFQYIDSWGDVEAEGATPASAGLPPLVYYDPSMTAAQIARFTAAENGAYVPFGGSSTKTQSVAAFADATYTAIPDKLFVTLGGRFSHDVVTDSWFKSNEFTPLAGYTGANGQNVAWGGTPYDFYNAAFNPTTYYVPTYVQNSFTPRAALRYKPDLQSSVYASYSRGYKAGILNVGGNSYERVAPETNDAYELGYKYETRQFNLDLAGFLYNYKNLQVSSYQSGAAEIRNAASARIYGVDAQGRYRFDSHLEFNAGMTWLHARYTSFPNAPYYSYCDPTAAYGNALYCSSGAGSIAETTTNASGYHMQRAPDVSGNVGASYGFDAGGGRATLSANASFTSSFYFDPEQQFKQSGYATVSLRGQWVSNHYTLAVFADNLTDKRYLTQVLFNTLGIGATWNAPTTYGVSVGYKF